MSSMDAENDIERGVYQTPSNDDEFYDDYDDEDGIGRGPVIAIFFVILMAAFVGVVWLSYNMGLRQGQQAAPPIIQASNLPFKSEPDEAGGLDEPTTTPRTATLSGEGLGSDVSISTSEEDPIDIGRETASVDVGSTTSGTAPIVPPPTDSIALSDPGPAQDTSDRLGTQSGTSAVEIAQDETPPPSTQPSTRPIQEADPVPAQESQVASVEPTSQPAVNPARPSTNSSGLLVIPRPSSRVLNASAGADLTTTPTTTTRPSTATTTQPAATTPRPSASTTTTAASRPQQVGPPSPSSGATPTGDFVIQVASFPEVADADAAWARLRSRHGDTIGNSVQDVQTADLGDRGTWYRLRIGYFTTRADANDVCEQLQANGQDCLVVSR